MNFNGSLSIVYAASLTIIVSAGVGDVTSSNVTSNTTNNSSSTDSNNTENITTTKVDGGVLYIPNPEFIGTDIFYYGVHDGHGHNVKVTVTQ